MLPLDAYRAAAHAAVRSAPPSSPSTSSHRSCEYARSQPESNAAQSEARPFARFDVAALAQRAGDSAASNATHASNAGNATNAPNGANALPESQATGVKASAADGALAACTSPPSDPARELSTLVIGLLERTFSGLITRLFVEAIPLPEATSFYRSAQQALRAICETDASVQTKVRDVAAVLRTLDRRLDTEAVRACTPMRALKSYLQAVLPWLQELDAQWCNFTMMADAWSSQTRWTAQALDLLGAIERLCGRPALREVVQQPGVAQALGHLHDLQQLLSKVDLLQSLPGQASLNDYIEIVAGGAAWPGRFGEVLQPVVLALSAVCAQRPCPVHAGLGDQIAWLMGVLTDPLARARVQPHLEMILGGAEPARQLSAVMQVSQSLARYPSELSLPEQARWLVKQVVGSDVMGAFGTSLAWTRPLVADKQVMAVFDAMLDMTHHAQGWPALMESVGRAALLGAGPWAASQVAQMARGYAWQAGAGHAMQWLSGYVMPREVRAEIEAFYQASSATESWSDMLARVSGCVYRLAKPQVVQHLLAEPTAAATVRYADLLQAHTDWKQTMAWFISQDTSGDALLGPLYGHFTTVLISWKVYEALGVEDVEQAESALRRLTRELKDMQLVRTYPQLGKLLDLLPLLPALRQVREQIRAMEASDAAPDARLSAPTWWDRAGRWQHALLQMDTPATQAAADRLSQCLQTWLIDAGMLACQYLAQAAALPVPGAAATPVSARTAAEASNTARRAGSTESTPIETAPAPLAAGVTLGVLGAAGLLYGVWQCTRGAPAYAAISAQAEAPPDASSDVLSEAPPDALSDALSDALADGSTGGRPVRPPISSTRRAMPFVLSVASLTAAGCLVYPYLREWWAPTESVESRDSDWLDPVWIDQIKSTHPDLVAALDSLDVPDWGVILDGTDSSADPAQGGPSTLLAGSSSGARRRVARDAAGTDAPPHPGMPVWLQRIVDESNLDPESHKEFALVIMRCVAMPYVKDAANDEEKEARAVIKLMQSVWELGRDETYLTHDRARARRLQAMWTALLPSYEALSYEHYGKAVRDFGRLFLVDATLDVRNDRDMSLPSNLATLAEQSMPKGEAIIKHAYAPILSPVLYIDQFIREGIARFHRRTGRAAGLTPTSRLKVTLHRVWDGDTSLAAKAHPVLTREFMIREIVTGQHYAAIAKAHPIYQYELASIERQGLIDDLQPKNLQKTMAQALKRLRSDNVQVTRYENFIEAMIVNRCLAYLDRKDHFPLFARSVTRFLQNSEQASLLLFRDQVVNGAFCIPVHGHQMALILSVDEPVCFHVFEFEHQYHAHGKQTAVLPDFPISPEFADWLYSKIPIKHATRYPDRASAMRNKYESYSIALATASVHFSDVMTSQPLMFSATVERFELPRQLANHSLDTIESDVDTLFWTEDEAVAILLLEGAKAAMNYMSGLTAIALPGTGTLLAVSCAFLAGVGPGAASSAAAMLQAHIANRPNDVDAFTRDALLGAAVAAVGMLPGALDYGNLVATHTLAVTRVREAMTTYRHMERVINQRYGVGTSGDAISQASLPGHRHTSSPDQAIPPWSTAMLQGIPKTESFIPGKIAPGGPAYDTAGHTDVPDSYPSRVTCVTCPINQKHHFPQSFRFRSLGLTPVPGREEAGYRTLRDSDYVQLYTLPTDGGVTPPSTILVVAAHGGYLSSTLAQPGIPIPPRMTLDMLCPHDTTVFDPSLHIVIDDPNFEAFFVLGNKWERVNFIPRFHAEWLFGPDCNPDDVSNTHGPLDGIRNTARLHYPDAPSDIASALTRNRVLSSAGIVPRSDVLALNDTVVCSWQADPKETSVAKILEVYQEGNLLNSNGVMYDKIMFSHCRADFDLVKGTSLPIHIVQGLDAIASLHATRWRRAIFRTTIFPKTVHEAERVVVELVAAYVYRIAATPVDPDKSQDSVVTTPSGQGSFRPRTKERVMSFHSSADRW